MATSSGLAHVRPYPPIGGELANGPANHARAPACGHLERPCTRAPVPPARGACTRAGQRTTMHDDETMLRAHTGTKPETPIDGVRQNWAFAPATGWPPSSSHASVAHTATRPSAQGPTSALRFNYYRSNHPRPRPTERTSEADGRSAISDLRATNDERRPPTGARGLPGAAPACGLWFICFGLKKYTHTTAKPQQQASYAHASKRHEPRAVPTAIGETLPKPRAHDIVARMRGSGPHGACGNGLLRCAWSFFYPKK